MNGLLCLKWNNHSSAFLRKLCRLRGKELYCDATIVCHDRYFPVHRLVLSTCSDYFEDIFEKIQCKHPFIIVKEIEPTELEALLNYMYKGEINVPQELLPKLIKAAEALKIKGLAVPDDEDQNQSVTKRDKRVSASSPTQSKRQRKFDDKNYGSVKRRSDMSVKDLELRIPKTENLSDGEGEPINQSECASESNIGVNNFVSVGVCKSNEEESALETSGSLGIANIKDEPLEIQGMDDRSLDSMIEFPYIDDSQSKDCNYIPDDTNSSVHSIEGSSSQQEQPQCSSWGDILLPLEQENKSNLEGAQDEMGGQNWVVSNQDTKSDSNIKGFPTIESVCSLKKCSYCKYTTSRNDILKKHILLKHRSTDRGWHRCVHCQYKCERSWHLQRHMLIHTGTKPFRCPKCPYRANRNDQLKSHMLRHAPKYITPYELNNMGISEVQGNFQRFEPEHVEPPVSNFQSLL